MEYEQELFRSAYKDSKSFTQKDVQAANATRLGSAADDYIERGIDLNKELIRNKPATFFFRMKGDAMQDAGIFDNDILVVDRSVPLANERIIIAVLNGELLVRRFHKNFTSSFLIAGNERFKTINLAEFGDFNAWGVVIYTIHAPG